MSNDTNDRFEALGKDGRKEVRKQWGKVHRRNFYCVYLKDFQTPYYIEIPKQAEELSLKYKVLYICESYEFDKEDIVRVFKVSMAPCLHNWHPNVFVDLSYQNSKGNQTFVMTLEEQSRQKGGFLFDKTKLIEGTAEMEAA